MDIIIIGERYSDNLGDSIICETTDKIVESIIKHKVIKTDVSCNNLVENSLSITDKFAVKLKKFRDKLYYEKKVLNNGSSKLLLYYKWTSNNFYKINHFAKKHHNSIVIFAGGQIIKNYFVFNIKNYVKYFSHNNAKIAFNACGISTHNAPFANQLFKHILANKNIFWLSTRSRLIDGKQFNNNFIQGYDSAILCADYFKISKDNNSQIVGLGIMNFDSEEKNSSFKIYLQSIIKYLESNQIKWQLFCNGDKNDYARCLSLFEEYKNSNYGSVANRPENSRQLIELVASYKKIISCRLHSLIVAYSLDIPTLGFSWSNKIDDFMDLINYNGVVAFDNSYWEKILDFFNNEYKYDLSKKDNIKKQIIKQFELILEGNIKDE